MCGGTNGIDLMFASRRDVSIAPPQLPRRLCSIGEGVAEWETDMSATMLTMLAITTVGAAVAWQRKQRVATAGRQLPRNSLRVSNPQLRQARTMADVWTLQPCNAACSTARVLANRRIATDDTVPLPLSGCSQNCQCHYRPLTNQRRIERRSGSSRRELFRLDAAGDRSSANRSPSRGADLERPPDRLSGRACDSAQRDVTVDIEPAAVFEHETAALLRTDCLAAADAVAGNELDLRVIAIDRSRTANIESKPMGSAVSMIER